MSAGGSHYSRPARSLRPAFLELPGAQGSSQSRAMPGTVMGVPPAGPGGCPGAEGSALPAPGKSLALLLPLPLLPHQLGLPASRLLPRLSPALLATRCPGPSWLPPLVPVPPPPGSLPPGCPGSNTRYSLSNPQIDHLVSLFTSLCSVSLPPLYPWCDIQCSLNEYLQTEVVDFSDFL